MKSFTRLAGITLLLATASVHAQQAAVPQSGAAPLYKSARVPVVERVRDLLGRMTLEEKVAQLQTRRTPLPPGPFGGGITDGLYKNGRIDDAVARRAFANGMGQFYFISFNETPAGEVAFINAIQRWVVENTRLGIPLFFSGEGLHGAALPKSTTFPQAIALGSTWDRALVEQIFTATGKELRSAGVTLTFSPVFDLGRDPRYGRIEEMYSEDPYLVGELGVKAVQGLQGRTTRFDADHVVATAKHFVHGQPENGTNVGPNDFSERTMREVFLAPFEKAVRIGRIGAVMASYNENNGGLPSNGNPWLLKNVLRRDWGFTGLVMSDAAAIEKMYKEQQLAETIDGAGIVAINAGVDSDLGDDAYEKLAGAVTAGKISLADVDTAVSRILTLKFEAGLFDRPYADARRATATVGAAAHAKIARQAAEEAPVLLRNEGALLPLDSAKMKTIAVIGPNADKVRVGTYAPPSAPYFVTVLDGIRKRLGGKATVTYAQGVAIAAADTDPRTNKITPYKAPPADKDTAMIAEAVETARNADTVVLVLGGNEMISREAFQFGFYKAFGDSDELELPGRQNDLVREIVKLGKPTVAVLLNGRPYSIAQLSQSVPAILEGWYLGQETGNAIAGILFGDINPSGRLPVTIARNVGQLPVYYYRKPTARLGYVFNANTPLYPFGYGLSYTSFTYGAPTLDRKTIARDGTATVSVTVTNTGKRAGAEVVQMYVHPKVSSVVQPVLRLAGFERVPLKAGESRTVRFPVGPEQLAIWDARMQHVVEAGKVEVAVGPNAAETKAVEIEVTP